MILKLKRWLLPGCLLALALGLILGLGALQQAAKQPVDAILVLGGSVQREIQVAQQRSTDASRGPVIPILISQGSADPCIRQIFQRQGTSLQEVWLEKCAQSTFDNFRFSLPILQQWGSHHVRLVTSPSHLPRAQWIGQIVLGAHGIWVEIDAVAETGQPGNQESWLKTALDLSRSLIWAVVSQVYQPRCPEVTPLAAVDLETWQAQGYKCEHQAGLD
ncbi:MAG: YdcF family protein [Cyanobacteria bacterium Co-bin13]|nr:YdcF family protein [Cyanobacteria bacterium Co-bin13]